MKKMRVLMMDSGDGGVDGDGDDGDDICFVFVAQIRHSFCDHGEKKWKMQQKAPAATNRTKTQIRQRTNKTRMR